MKPKQTDSHRAASAAGTGHEARQFCTQIAAILGEADRAIQAMAGGSHHRLYQFLRQSAAQLAPTDAFYVGFYSSGQSVSFPYSFDGGEYDDPSPIPYGEHGLSAWMLRQRRPYWSGEDGGKILHRGRQFGDEERRSEDAIVVPIFDHSFLDHTASGQSPDAGDVVGLMSMQTYRPGSYDAQTVRAFAFLAGSLSTVLAREREDERRRAGLGVDPIEHLPVADRIGAHLRALRRGIDAVRRYVPPDASELNEAVSRLQDECELAQTEVAELLAGAGQAGCGDPLEALTARQREVAELAAQGLGVKQIAAKLFISEHTVKDHQTAIRSKLGISGRSGIAAHLRRVLPLSA